MGALDVASRAYDPPVFARFTLEISRALTVLDGPLLVLVPGAAAVSHALELLDDDNIVPPELRERLRVSSVGLQGPPTEAEVAPAAVVIAGLTNAVDADDTTYRDARAWLRLGKVVVCINARIGANALPRELAQSEAAYCLTTFTVARTDTWRGDDADKYAEDEGSAALWRRFPGDWKVMLDMGNSGEWVLVDELKQRPGEGEITQMVLPRVERRQMAIDSTRRALGLPDEPGVPPSAAGSGAQPPGSADGADGAANGGVAAVDGIVLLSWAQIQAAGAWGPMALYTAATLHRMRTLGGEANFDRASDARGVHMMMPAVEADLAAAWEPDYGKLRGGLVASCQLVADGAGDGIATIEQLAVDAAAEPASVRALLRRAMAEAMTAKQVALVVAPLTAFCNSIAEAELRASGFEPVGTGDEPPSICEAFDGAAGVLWMLLGEVTDDDSDGIGGETTSMDTKELDGMDLPAAAEEPASEADGPAIEAADGPLEATEPEGMKPASDEGPEDSEKPINDGEAEDEGDADDDGETLASEEDIARLKRMFGSTD